MNHEFFNNLNRNIVDFMYIHILVSTSNLKSILDCRTYILL